MVCSNRYAKVMRWLAVPLLLIMAACDKSSSTSKSSASANKSARSSAARHISDGAVQSWHGVSFDIPKGWRAQLQQDTLLLLPADANASGMLEELCAMTA